MKYIILPIVGLVVFLAIFIYYFIGYLIYVLWQFDINPKYQLNKSIDELLKREIMVELKLDTIDDLTWLLFIKYRAIVVLHNIKYYL